MTTCRTERSCKTLITALKTYTQCVALNAYQVHKDELQTMNNLHSESAKNFSVEKFTVTGKLFHMFITRSAKKLLRILAVHRGLNNL